MDRHVAVGVVQTAEGRSRKNVASVRTQWSLLTSSRCRAHLARSSVDGPAVPNNRIRANAHITPSKSALRLSRA
jgi:hypothetical protein